MNEEIISIWSTAWVHVKNSFDFLSQQQKCPSSGPSCIWNEHHAAIFRASFRIKKLLRSDQVLTFFSMIFDCFIARLKEQTALLEALEGHSLVERYVLDWGNYLLVVKDVHDILQMQCIRTHRCETPDIFLRCMALWKEHVFLPLKPKILSTVFEIMTDQRERSLSAADSFIVNSVQVTTLDVVSEIIRTWLILGDEGNSATAVWKEQEDYWKETKVFVEEYMEPFIKITKLFYQNRAVDWMEMGISHYIDQTMRAVTLEENILRSFKVSSEDEAQSSLFKSLLFIIKLSLVQIHPIIDNIHSIYGFAVEILSQNVLEAVRRILISNNSSKIIDGMKSLLHQENWNYLSSIAQLFNSTNEIQLFADTVKEHIIMLGKEKLDLMKSINSKNSGVEYVTSLTDICCGFHRISKEHFDYDGVQVVLGSAYASVVNLYTRTSASVASYFNFIIRSGKNFDSEELITKITNGIFLVSYLNDKDYFFTMYEKLLAKRLVDSNNGLFNINLDVEQNILSLLTSNFGKTSVLKCERMFSDYYVSLDINERYNEWSVARKSNLQEREISTSVLLVSNNWPTMDCTKSTLSCKNEVLLDNWRLFEQFYKTSHSNRRLVPLWNYHRVEIFINHSIWNSKAGYQLNLDIPSFTVLSLFFTTDDNYNIPLISESTGYPEALVRFIISNFTDKKTAILMENKSTNSYSINANFSTRQKKLVFSSYQATTPENMIVCGKIQQERELFLDTIIVRIMKARKSYSHTNLLSEVIKLSAQRFIPTPALFKKRIQVLIEREFIVRDTDNMNILHYRA